MARQRYTTPATPRVIESGDGWTVCYDPSTKDYSAYVGGEYQGSRNTPTEARMLAAEYFAERHTPEKVAQLILEDTRDYAEYMTAGRLFRQEVRG